MTITVCNNIEHFLEHGHSSVFVALNLFSLANIKSFERPCTTFWVDGVVGEYFLKLKRLHGVQRSPGIFMLYQAISSSKIRKIIMLGSAGAGFSDFCSRHDVAIIQHEHLYNFDGVSDVQLMDTSCVDLVVLSLPSPKQETLAFKLVKAYPGLKFLCVGGAVSMIDHPKLRAPLWVSVWGLEWLFRLRSDTKRRLFRLASSGAGLLFGLRYLYDSECRHL